MTISKQTNKVKKEEIADLLKDVVSPQFAEFTEHFNQANKQFDEYIKNNGVNALQQFYKDKFNKDYPYEVIIQKIDKNNLDNLEILPLSVPFLKYNPKDDEYYLVYHAINKDKFLNSYSEKVRLSEDKLTTGKDKEIYLEYHNKKINLKDYIATIDDDIKQKIKENIKSLLSDKDKNLEIINLEINKGNSSNREIIEDFSSFGFSIVPLSEKGKIAIVPDSIVKYPTLFSTEHEIDLNEDKVYAFMYGDEKFSDELGIK